MFKIFRKPESYGKTKLDHVLTYISYALRDACVLGVSVAFIYWAIYWISQLISNWIYKALQEVNDEIMEQIYKRILANQQALLHKRYIENLIVASNCLGTTARLSAKKPCKLFSELTDETKKRIIC